MCGTDWRTYELMYYDLGEMSIKDIFQYKYIEPFYSLINIISSKLNACFWTFFITLKICISIILFKTLKDNCPVDVIYLALLFFLSFFGFFMLVDNPMRNVIAVAITSLAIPQLFKGKVVNYCLIVFIAVLFHYSAIFMLVLYPIIRRKNSNKCLIVAYIVVNVIFINPEILYQIVAYIASPFPILTWKIEAYLKQLDSVAGGKLFSLGLLTHFLFFILLLYSRRNIERIPNGSFIFNLAIIFPIVFRMGLTSLVFSRFQLYVALFYSIAVCLTIYRFSFSSRIVYKLCIVVICFYTTYNTVTSDYRYIPYTNYFYEQIFGRELTFEERSDYNKLNSPYKNKDIFKK